MGSRTAKRVAQVAHIISKPYYTPVDSEPDPLVENCPTRMWKYRMRVWVETLKGGARKGGSPEHEEEALDVTAGTL